MFNWLKRATSWVGGHPRQVATAVGMRPAAGVWVDEDSALNYSAVWACVRVLSETLAMLPWRAYRRTTDGRELAVNSAVDRLLHSRPNSYQTPFVFRQLLMAHALTWGNGLAEIEWSVVEDPVALHPIHPARVQDVQLTDDGIVYRVLNADNRHVTLRAEDVFHVSGLSRDGLWGLSPIAQAREAIGLGLAAERFGSQWFGNGSRPGGILTHPKKLDRDGRKVLKEEWEKAHTGNNGNRVAVLEEGMTWTALSVPPEDAQFLETRKFQLQEICRWYGVPPHKLADLERATWANIEHQGLDFISSSVGPWAVRLEQEADRKLYGRRQASTAYTKINLAAVARGDQKTRYDAYAVGRQWGWLSVNDVRGLEDLNPVDGGDLYLVPANMTTPEKLTAPPPAPPAAPAAPPLPQDASAAPTPPQATPADDAQRELATAASGPIFREVIARLLRKEQRAIERAAARHNPAELESWAERFYERHAQQLVDAVLVPAGALARLMGREPGPELREAVAGWAGQRVNAARAELTRAAAAGEVAAAIAGWEQQIEATAQAVMTQVVQLASGAAAHE
jgi:HK97 family phage portal protein